MAMCGMVTPLPFFMVSVPKRLAGRYSPVNLSAADQSAHCLQVPVSAGEPAARPLELLLPFAVTSSGVPKLRCKLVSQASNTSSAIEHRQLLLMWYQSHFDANEWYFCMCFKNIQYHLLLVAILN